MCNFCEHIVVDDCPDKNAIVYDRKYDDFHIEVPDADPYCGGILEKVKFCPCCGGEFGQTERRTEMTILILKFICLLLACVYGFSNIGKVIVRSGEISNIQMFLMGLGVAGFIFLQWVL